MLMRRKSRRKAAQVARLLDQLDAFAGERKRRSKRIAAVSLR